jgi:hypothetical protein
MSATMLNSTMQFAGKFRLKSVLRTINWRVLIVPQSIWMEEDMKMFRTRFPKRMVFAEFFKYEPAYFIPSPNELGTVCFGIGSFLFYEDLLIVITMMGAGA